MGGDARKRRAVDWQRIDVEVDLDRRVGAEPLAPGRKVDIVVPAETINVVPLPEITISNYHMGEQDISFDVSQIGVPVLVKMSYFPNWEVDGAEGPYRIAPNSMVVVPTSTHVRLHYEPQALDRIAYLLTFLGIALMIFWRVRGDVRHRSAHPFITASEGIAVRPEASNGDGTCLTDDVLTDDAADRAR